MFTHQQDDTLYVSCRELSLVPPLLGSSQQLLNRDHTKTYYSDMPRCQTTSRVLRRHGDEVQRLPGGYYRALGRCDDTMNLGGIKVGWVLLVTAVLPTKLLLQIASLCEETKSQTWHSVLILVSGGDKVNKKDLV